MSIILYNLLFDTSCIDCTISISFLMKKSWGGKSPPLCAKNQADENFDNALNFNTFNIVCLFYVYFHSLSIPKIPQLKHKYISYNVYCKRSQPKIACCG